MTNSDIADIIKLFANLTELHGGNEFKIKSYSAASFKIDKLLTPLEGKSIEELEKIDGVGKSLAGKIFELNHSETFTELQQLIEATPAGVIDMMRIKGIGPKKIAMIWKEMAIESIGELLYACRENRLAQAKGFGLKTQENVIQQIEFIFASAHKFHYAKVEKTAQDLVKHLAKYDETDEVSLTGAIRRKCDTIDALEVCIAINGDENNLAQYIAESLNISEIEVNTSSICFSINGTLPVIIYFCEQDDYTETLFETTAAAKHLELLQTVSAGAHFKNASSETEIYTRINLPYIEPEMREGVAEIKWAQNPQRPALIELTDLKGILHNHSTYSDGQNTLEEMAIYCKELGYQYLGICDHSKAAFYAKGMKEETILLQHAEVDKLNQKLGSDGSFKVFKGIESDILNDGSLDYSNDVLASFDFIVASIHSNLKMSEEKAMNRLLRAIENPYTTILGHPTGRLLLMREGYPVDHQKMIDACAANNVIIEINAHPYRLDLDWRWVDYALNKGVKLSVNPDAHEREGYHDMYYGVCAARKGGLHKEMCLNALSLPEITTYFQAKKP
ncbi:MAG: helix-hairpin-helix domain-containing protein [Bacteroidota bacterium]